MTQAPAFTAEQLEALEVARTLVARGVPLFLAEADPAARDGFRRPNDWQQTIPDPSVVDRWQPGMALCAVMGHGLDLLDLDPRNGGNLDALDPMPTAYGSAVTPSGGVHVFIRSLGVGSRDGVFPGVDVKGGLPDGSSRGYAYIAPTVRPSKVTGEPGAYRWTQAPAGWLEAGEDVSGAVLAARVQAMRGTSGRVLGGPDWWREFCANKEPQAAAAADKAIGEKLAEVRGWRVDQGTNFRTVLMRAAMTLGGYVGGGYLDESAAWAWLEQACAEVWGTPDKDDRLWIQQGLGDGATRPFHVYTPADEQEYGEAAQAVAATRAAPSWSPYRGVGVEVFDPQMCSFDQELAEAVAARTAPVMRYAADAGSWLVREAEAWREREDLSGWAVALVARLMPLGTQPVPKDVTARTAEHWQAVRRQRFMTSGGAGGIERKLRAIVRAGDHPSALELATLDSEPEVLWAGGVPWDLRASREAPVAAGIDPATPHLRTALVAPQRIDTPHWDAFVATVWPDPLIRAWALRVLSISLAGYPDAALPVLYGPERTGKTALISLIVKALGSYGHAADPRLLGSGIETAHASVVYALKGRRLSFIDEGPRRGQLAAERLKQLTGGGELTGNAMRANPVTFAPTHTLIMTTNDEPPITDPALRARVRLIPCEADKAEVRRARQAITPAVWELEAPGVLAALMGECAAWLADPDSATNERAPDVLVRLVDDIAASQDPVHEWVEMRTVPADPGTPASELYEAFCAWYAGQARFGRTAPLSMTAWGRRLNELGYPAHLNGPRGKVRYRPLTVMGGTGGLMPTVPEAPRVAEGLPRVAEGLGGQPSAPENASSTPVFSDVPRVAEGYLRTINYTSNPLPQTGDTDATETEKVREQPSAPSAPSADAGLPAETGAEGCGTTLGKPSANPRQTPSAPRDDHGDHGSSQVNPDVSEAKAAKAQVRAAERERVRLELVATLGGEVLPLPAVVDRDGNVVPLDLEQARAVVTSAIQRSGALTVDVETTGYPLGHRHYALRSVQLGDATAAVVLHPVEHAELIRELLEAAPILHAHTASADLAPLDHAGLIDAESGWSRMRDTGIYARLERPHSDGGLKPLARELLEHQATAPAADEARSGLFKAGKWLTDTKPDTPPERSGWAQVETGCTTMLRYAASDVLDTAALAHVFAPLEQHGAKVLERERTAQRMTARVAHRGLRLDAAHIGEMTAKHTAARAEAGARVRAYGVDNPGSDMQVGAAAARLGAELPKTKTGRLSVAEGVLDPFKADPGELGAFVTAVLEYRHHDTVLGTFLGPFRALCEHGDGRARPTVYTLGADTGRMSCVRPNFQQLSREGRVRACVVADPGYVFITADFAGVELRGAAALSQDPAMIYMIAEEDAGRFDGFHWEVARQAFGPNATKSDRYVAKRGVFGTFYGGGAEGLARQIHVPVAMMEQVRGSLRGLAPTYFAWADQLRQAVRQGATHFPTYSGRVIHLPADAPHKAPAYAIQGTCRELLVDALIRWQGTRWGTCTLLPVHDELLVMVPEGDAEEATAELVRCMQGNLFGVPIVAEPSAPAFAWADST